MIAPVLGGMAREYEGKCAFYKVSFLKISILPLQIGHYLKFVNNINYFQHHVTNTDAAVIYFKIFKVDVDELEEVSMSAKIECMPTFLFFKDGNKIATVEGANQAKILQVITTNI